MALRVAINGFGRIGRSILRLLATARRDDGIEIACINDIAPLDSCAYLFEYDSVFGPFPGRIEAGDAALSVEGRAIPFHHEADLSRLDLAGVDLVLECTGRANDPAVAARGLKAGAGRVLISGPSEAAEATVVLGANDGILADQRILSCGSCTTNALAPLLRLIDGLFGLEGGHMTTVHCYTGAQPTVDAPRADPARSRAAALSMVPTSSSAGRLTDLVLPDLAGRVSCTALRVPVASVSAVDLTVRLRDRGDIDARLRAAVTGSPVLGWTDRPLVSSDLRARPESLILAGPEIRHGPELSRLFGWYDNEWGFSNRMIDLALRMGARR